MKRIISLLQIISTQNASSELASYFEGTVLINDMPHKLSCSCGDSIAPIGDGVRFSPPAVCDQIATSNVGVVRQSKAGVTEGTFTDDDVSAYYGQPRVMSVGTLVRDYLIREFRCADARWVTKELYTLGGDLAELLLVLNAAEAARQAQIATSQPGSVQAEADGAQVHSKIEQILTKEEIGQAVMAWAGRTTSFTWCTDREAVSKLSSVLGTSIDLTQVPATLQNTLITALSSEPNVHGDTLWKCLVNDPSRYRIRRELLSGVIRAFFSLLWAPQVTVPVAVKIHTGNHSPKAVINIYEKPACAHTGAAISATQALLGGSTVTAVLLNTAAVTEHRTQMIDLVVKALNNPPTSPTALVDIVNHNAREWLETCVDSAWPEIPVYALNLE